MGQKRKHRRAGHMPAKQPVSDRQRGLYDRLIATHPAIARKGRNLLYTSVNGHMFTVFSTSATLGIRLSPADREQFVKQFKTSLLESYGVVMKEYVAVPDSLLARTATLAPWLARSHDYVRSLKPKPTTRG